jgi:hypothetical protein
MDVCHGGEVPPAFQFFAWGVPQLMPPRFYDASVEMARGISVEVFGKLQLVRLLASYVDGIPQGGHIVFEPTTLAETPFHTTAPHDGASRLFGQPELFRRPTLPVTDEDEVFFSFASIRDRRSEGRIENIYVGLDFSREKEITRFALDFSLEPVSVEG